MQTVAVRPAAVEPVFGGSLVRDAKAAGKYFTAVEAVLQAQKAEEQHAGEAALKSRARAVKEQFFRRHAAAIYDEVTDDGALSARYSAGGRVEATAAIAAARKAFDEGTWAHDPRLRSRALIELADRLGERADAIALMLSREMGKVLRDATLEATWSPGTLRYNAGTALSQTGTSAEIAPGLFASAMREPIGVSLPR